MSDSVFSDWKFFPLKQKVNNLIGNGKVTVAGTVQVSFTVIEGQNGVFASLPSQKSDKIGDNGKPMYYPLVKILDGDTYKEFQAEMAEQWDAATNGEVTDVPVVQETKTKQTGKKVPF